MKAIGAILLVLAFAIAVLPQYTDCLSQGAVITLPSGMTMPMKCHWTRQAELATAGPLAAVGILMGFSKRKRTIRALGVVGIVVGLFVILLPGTLIGVCASKEMICNMIMRPSLILGGILAIVTSVIALLASRGPNDQPLVIEGGAT
jgi:hypothetical protein